MFTPGSLEGLQKLGVPVKPFKVTIDIIPRVWVPTQKGQSGEKLELLRQPPDLVLQVCSSASLPRICAQSCSRGQRVTQGPGMAILGTFRDDHSVTSYCRLRASFSQQLQAKEGRVSQSDSGRDTRVT